MSRNEAVNPQGARPGLTFNQGIKRGNILFISGQLGNNPDRTFPPDIKTQCQLAYEKIGEILRAAGATFDDVVKTTDFITTMEDYRDTAEVRRQFFTNGFSAATGVVVKRLVRTAALIEVEAIAVVD